MWQTVFTNVFPVVVTILTPVVLVIVGRVMQKLASKWHLDNLLTYENKVDDLVVKGIQAVEQKSLAAVAKGGEPTPGEKKLDEALKFVNAQLDALGLPQKASAELQMLIESHLFNGASDQPTPAPAPAPSPAPVPAPADQKAAA